MESLKSIISHEKNRKKVCAPCGKKITFGNAKPEKYMVTAKLCSLIKSHVNKNYTLDDERFPLSICGTCQTILFEHEKKNKTRLLPVMPNYEDILLNKITRNQLQNNDNTCNCYICITGSSKIHTKTSIGRGHCKEPIVIGENNGLYSNKQKVNNTHTLDSQPTNKKSVSIDKIINMINELPK